MATESMIRRVLKWKVPVDDRDHQIPGYYLAAAALDHANVNVWTEVIGDPDHAPLTPYRIYGTGQPIDNGHLWVATTLIPPFVWHLFQTGPTS